MKRIEALLAAMTLEEKIGQLTMVSFGWSETGPNKSVDIRAEIRAGRIGSLLNIWGADETRAIQRLAVEETRLGVPLLLAFDVLHGHRTIFPIPLAEAALFDPAAWERTAREAALEAAADGIALTFAPMLDVSRDPRWGRIAEGPGEDPVLAALFAEAKVRGFQGGDLASAGSLAATAKHIGAYGAVTAGRDYASVDISDRALHEVYLPPFRAAVAAGAAAVMPAFSDLAGTPASANATLLRGLLRERWGFEGVVVSDHGAVAELVVHGVAADLAEAAALALAAGVDIDMMGMAYAQGLVPALERGRVDMGAIDAAVRRVLQLKESLGLFDDPYRRGSAAGAAAGAASRGALARDVARRSIVLLTNNGVLPLARDLRRIAVVGPLAMAAADMLGPWAGAGDPARAVTMVAGLRAALPQCEVVFAAGVEVDSGETRGMIEEALAACRAAEVVVLCLGEGAQMSGEAASRAQPDLPGRQRQFAEAVLAVGRPVVALLSSGRPLMVPWLIARADAVLATWFLGSEAGHAVADVLTGRWNPSGRLPLSWPVDTGQIPIFYGQRRTGRPADPAERYSSKYIDAPAAPLFPFGHGLSYTRFTLSDLQVAPAVAGPHDRVTVAVTVANEGPVDGEETVLLFVHDLVASVARPVLELKGMAKVRLAPGERQVLHLILPVDDLAFLDLDLKPRLEPGAFKVYVGPAADPERLLEASLSVVGD
ncbi:glycoside hydrolase family 3 N-terminal domain-containing protein [Chelatococcus sp. SYSU_G07232]|uniref:beta-glucosidase n=2 Tax=Chelatococcus albus TaxID=3047466 RepID=A0ABT7ACH2_9HYPH|nr:glycoside hydrolase family 3 N-terminal domain-containing protein [Chelatococcus sp. SYSU_G07232]